MENQGLCPEISTGLVLGSKRATPRLGDIQCSQLLCGYTEIGSSKGLSCGVNWLRNAVVTPLDWIRRRMLVCCLFIQLAFLSSAGSIAYWLYCLALLPTGSTACLLFFCECIFSRVSHHSENSSGSSVIA